MNISVGNNESQLKCYLDYIIWHQESVWFKIGVVAFIKSCSGFIKYKSLGWIYTTYVKSKEEIEILAKPKCNMQ